MQLRRTYYKTLTFFLFLIHKYKEVHIVHSRICVVYNERKKKVFKHIVLRPLRIVFCSDFVFFLALYHPWMNVLEHCARLDIRNMSEQWCDFSDFILRPIVKVSFFLLCWELNSYWFHTHECDRFCIYWHKIIFAAFNWWQFYYSLFLYPGKSIFEKFQHNTDYRFGSD